jgi:hypothetical protein
MVVVFFGAMLFRLLAWRDLLEQRVAKFWDKSSELCQYLIVVVRVLVGFDRDQDDSACILEDGSESTGE